MMPLRSSVITVDTCPEGTEPAPQTRSGTSEPQQCIPKCEEGTVRDPKTNACVDPCDGKSGPVDYGGVACVNNEPFKACVWPENFDETSDKARERIQACVKVHETTHLNAPKDIQYCVTDSEPVDRQAFNRDKNLRECDGYITELQCLDNAEESEAACNEDSLCLEELAKRREYVIRKMENNCTAYLSNNIKRFVGSSEQFTHSETITKQ